jgi:hypothetical protein
MLALGVLLFPPSLILIFRFLGWIWCGWAFRAWEQAGFFCFGDDMIPPRRWMLNTLHFTWWRMNAVFSIEMKNK